MVFYFTDPVSKLATGQREEWDSQKAMGCFPVSRGFPWRPHMPGEEPKAPIGAEPLIPSRFRREVRVTLTLKCFCLIELCKNPCGGSKIESTQRTVYPFRVYPELNPNVGMKNQNYES